MYPVNLCNSVAEPIVTGQEHTGGMSGPAPGSSTDLWGLWTDLGWLGWENTERLDRVGTAPNPWLQRVLKGPQMSRNRSEPASTERKAGDMSRIAAEMV